MKTTKTMTINTVPHKVVARIHELETELKERDGTKTPDQIKSELRDLYKLRKKQKKYIAPPKPRSKKGF